MAVQYGRNGAGTVDDAFNNLNKHFSPNSCSSKGSYFKYRGKGSQIFWIRFGRAVWQGVVLGPRCCLIVYGCSQILIRFGGGGVGQVLSDVCMVEGWRILIRFGGLAPRFVKEC